METISIASTVVGESFARLSDTDRPQSEFQQWIGSERSSHVV